MADFTLSQIQETSSAPTGVQKPIVTPSDTEAALGLFSGLAQSYASTAPSAAQRAKEQKAADLSVAGAEFSQLQLNLANAVDRGDLSSQEARMRMRANYANAIANNPALTSELADIHKQIIGTAGLGKVAQEGTAQEQAFMKAQESATLAGWVNADMSQEEAREATSAWLSLQRQQAEIDAEENEIALRRARTGEQADQVGLSTARMNNQTTRLNLSMKKQQIRSREATKAAAEAYHVKFRNDTNSILKALETGQIDEARAVEMLDGQWATVQSEISLIGTEAGAEYVSNLAAPMKFLLDSAKERASGKIENEMYQQRIDKAIGLQTLELLGDPRNVRAVATSRLLPNADITNYTAVESAAIRMMESNSQEGGPSANLVASEDPEQASTYLQIVKDNLKGGARGDLLGGDESIQQVDTNLNKILKGVSAYSAAVDNPSQYNQLIEFLASPEYGNYVSTHGTGINQENAYAAKETVQQQYEQEVLPILRQEWDNVSITTSTLPTSPTLGTTGTEEQVSEVVEPVWSGAGISFKSSDPSNTRINAKARNLNKKVAPIVNRLVRMSAHLEGHKNYKQVYEGNYATIFGGEQESNE